MTNALQPRQIIYEKGVSSYQIIGKSKKQSDRERLCISHEECSLFKVFLDNPSFKLMGGASVDSLH